MKKILFIFSVMIFAVIACGSKEDDEPKPIEPQIITDQETDIEQEDNPQQDDEQMAPQLIITVGGRSLTADFAQNSSAEALIEALKKSPITYQAHDYGGFEKVGDLGVSFPQNNEQITTSPGDIILYQGNNLCIYYGKNTWNFTRIAQIQDVGKEDLLDFLGDGEIEVKLEVK